MARAQIRAYAHAGHSNEAIPDIITAWEQAKHLKAAEEYRLLYVAMTRAKRLLWMSAAQQAPVYLEQARERAGGESLPGGEGSSGERSSKPAWLTQLQ